MKFFIFLFLVIPLIKGSSRDERRSDAFRSIFIFYIIFAVLGSVLSSPIAGVALIALLIFAYNKWKKKRESDERREKYGWDSKRWDAKGNTGKRASTGNYKTGSYKTAKSSSSQSDAAAAKVFSVILPKQVSKRRKIVQEFNKKYKLYLTDEQVEGIVDSSYMSETWKREVEAMAKKYATVYEWFQGDTKWLRAYLQAFHVQDVTSDFVQQERIVVTAFEEIMRYSDSIGAMPLPERIREINRKYYTDFNDVTYMIAYRFLEERGLFHTLEAVQPLRDDEDLEELMQKYRSMPTQ